MAETAQQIADKLIALEYSDLALPRVDQVDGQGFAGLSGGIVTAARALDVVRQPDQHRIYRFEDLEMLLALRRVDAGRIPFVIVLIAVNRQGWRVTGAFRLRFDDPGQLDQVSASPALAFGTFLARYGAQFNTGNGERSLFVPIASFPAGSWTGNPADLFRLLAIDMSTPGAAHLHFRVPAADEPLKLGWPFVVRTADYAAAER